MYQLNFKYKGNRDYVHGTDLFNEIVKVFVGDFGINFFEQLDMSIYRQIINNIDMYVYKNEQIVKPEDYVVSFSFKNKANQYACVLKENERLVKERYEYHEDNIIKNSIISIDAKTIKLIKDIEYSNIENIVAMNKGLLQKLFPGLKKKWLFVRLQLSNYDLHKKFNQLELVFKSNFNFKLTKSVIFHNGKEIGEIYFSVK